MSGGIAFGECPRPALAAATAIVADSRCATLSVPEDRARPEGRHIALNIMVIPSISAQPRPDPIFFLAGGPGQAATEIGPLVFRTLSAVRKHRDVVLVDQRGTGASSPLACAVDTPDDLTPELSLQHLEELQLQMVQQCLDELQGDPSGAGPDPRFYTTPIAMADLDAVRAALGYDRINLIGGSYGTRAALVYLRNHGEHVRAAVLDAVVPLTMRIPFTMATDASRALELLLRDCEADPDCQASFPELRAHLDALVARLRAAPEAPVVVDPFTGEPIPGPMFARSLIMLVRAALYSSDLSALLPLAIEAAYAGDYQLLATMASFFGGDGMGLSIGMFLSVICSEDIGARAGYTHPEAAASPLFEEALPEEFGRICAIWPQGDIAADYFTPVRSDRPVLLLSGALDPVTPPRWGEEALATLDNARHIVVPGAAHGTMQLTCMRSVIAAFIDDPQPALVTEACSDRVQRPAFFYSKAGPVRRAPDD